MKDITNFFFKPFVSPVRDQLEKKILSCLKKGLTPIEIFEKIQNSSDVYAVSRFLYNSVLDKTLIDYSVNRLEQNKEVSWPFLIKLFLKYKIRPSKKLEQILFHYFLKREENQSPALFACKSWGDISPGFQSLFAIYIQNLEKKLVSEEKDLLEKLEFVKAKSLIKEEEEIVNRLQVLNPHSSKYKVFQKELKEKQAVNFIETEKKQSSFKKVNFFYNLPCSEEEKKLKTAWFKSAVSIVNKEPVKAKNLSLFFAFCGWPDKALKIMDIKINHISDYWFYLDWLFETKEYTKGIELINRLLEEVKDIESVLLPLIYIKAQMLYALGQKKIAIDYLKAISQVQVNYKSVDYLLSQWIKNEQ